MDPVLAAVPISIRVRSVLLHAMPAHSQFHTLTLSHSLTLTLPSSLTLTLSLSPSAMPVPSSPHDPTHRVMSSARNRYPQVQISRIDGKRPLLRDVCQGKPQL